MITYNKIDLRTLVDVRTSRAQLSFYIDWYRPSAGLHAGRQIVCIHCSDREVEAVNYLLKVE